MVVGDIKKINLSISSFERMITDGNLYVDKTRFIENFLNEASNVQLITRQRRLGKSLNIDMLRCFLTDKTDNRHLFKGLYIENSPVWDKANSAPVFYFDFKELGVENYQEALFDMVRECIYMYCDETTIPLKVQDYLREKKYNETRGLRYLTESIYQATGKRSYILIDEYDKLLMDNYDTERYKEIRRFETAFLSSALKGNQYLEKAILTGVLRISHEGMMSDLNNLVTYDVFNDNTYTDDYGLTEEEMAELCRLTSSDFDEMTAWYNGIRIKGKAIYNVYAVMSCLRSGEFDCYWGKSGALEMIVRMINDKRKMVIAKLLNGEKAELLVNDRISLKQLAGDTLDEAFYSLLVQTGYFALDKKIPERDTVLLSIPNKELRIVWRRFILTNLYSGTIKVKTLFDNAGNPDDFARDLEYFLSDRLSYHDLESYKDEDEKKTHERVYHIFLLGLLSGYDDVRCRPPLSNRESGDGRYDIFVERPGHNFIFEFKSCTDKENLETQAAKALGQIELKRYGAAPGENKPLTKIGVAFHGKRCRIKVAN